MKTLLQNTIVAFTLIISFSSKSQNLDVQFDFCQFTSENNTFLETYLSIDGKSTQFIANNNGKYQSTIEVSFEFKDKNGNISKFDQYNLLSPIVEDTNDINFIFLDQQRYTLSVGEYDLTLKINDLNSKELNNIEHKQKISIFEQNGLSDIQFVDSFSETKSKNILSKSGYDLTPFVSNFYNQSNHKVNYYYEYYNKSAEKRLLRTSLKSVETKKVVNNLYYTKWSKNKKTVVLSSFPIKDLPSGTFKLVVEVINKDNDVIDQKEKILFKYGKKLDYNQVDIENTFASKIQNVDTLKQFIRYLYPIENSIESLFSSNQLNYDSLHLMQKYFYQFWKKRSAFNPEQAWLDYLKKVAKVNNEFRFGMADGYLSDRGRIYLLYGAPNSRTEEYLPKQFEPFEVWHYYQLENERDVRFVFSNKNRPNEYRLVYSNKIGEVSDIDWINRFEENYYENDSGNQSPWDFFNNPQ